MSDGTPSARITITPNGPYVISGSVPLTERYPAMSTYGEPLTWDPVGADIPEPEPQERYALCRCGHSGHKPFCDGTHSRIGFDGTLTASHEPSATRREAIPGPAFVLTDDASLCVHAGFCGTRLTHVWDMIARTDDPETRTRLQEMVSNCPSGRLQITPAAGGEPIEPEYVPSIAAITDGPLWVRGGIQVQTLAGETYEVRNRVTLCRCGASNNKPFCDGTHGDINFRAPQREVATED